MCVQCCYSTLRNGKLVGGGWGGCWHEWYRLDAGLKIKSLIRSLMWEITEVGLRKNCQWNVLSLKTWVGIWKAKASPKARGSTRMCVRPTLTLHWQHRPINLTDRSVASSASGCDIEVAGVCPAHTHMYTLLELQDASWLTSGQGATRSASTACGVEAGRASWGGPFT